MLKHRKYRSGSRWALFRWTETDSGYITRLHLVMTPWFAICLHWLNKPDPEPYLHDHPVSFLSIILRGWYQERRSRIIRVLGVFDVPQVRYPCHRWFNWIKADPDDKHTIIAVAPKTLTLCFMGPKRREWGFHTRNGWLGWKAYNDRKRAGDQP